MEGPERIAGIVDREWARLRSFIRRRVPNTHDVEDILQDVFYELVEANRRLMPIDQRHRVVVSGGEESPRQIQFWEALGLLALSRILFGGFNLGGGHQRTPKGGGQAWWKKRSSEEQS